jgi:hypothetical protein
MCLILPNDLQINRGKNNYPQEEEEEEFLGS